MHHFFSLIIDRSPGYQSPARIAVGECTNHTLLVIDYKEYEWFWHPERVNTRQCFKKRDVL